MSDPSEVIAGGVAPMVEEQGGGKRKGRGKSREPTRAREELGDLETRLAKVELVLIEEEEKFEEVDTRIEELGNGIEEFRKEMQGALDSAVDKLASEMGSLRHAHSEENAAIKEENHFLRAEMDRMMGRMKELEEQLALLRSVVVQGGMAATPSTSGGAPMARVEVPKPQAFRGTRNAKEIDNFLWSLEQYFKALGIVEDARKIDHAPLYLADTAMVWWRRREADIEKGTCTLETWDDFKRELKRQFYPVNAAHEARARLRRLTQRGTIRDYVKEFTEVILEIPGYPDNEALFAFMDGLQHWARLEIERRGAQDLATAISIAESLTEYQKGDKGKGVEQVKAKNSSDTHESKEGSAKPWRPKEGLSKGWRRPEGEREKPLQKCFLCDGPHMVRECPKRKVLSSLVEEKEASKQQGENMCMGALQLAAIDVKPKEVASERKGRLFAPMEVKGQSIQALVDTGASHNFMKLDVAKKLGVPFQGDKGWLKVVNSFPTPTYGVARNVQVKIGEWTGTLDFYIINLDDHSCVLGMDFMDKVKAVLLPYANDMCLADGNTLKAINLARGKSATSTLSSLQVVSPKELPKESLPPKRGQGHDDKKKRVGMTVDAMGPKSSLLRRIKDATMRDGQAKQLVRLARDGVTRKFVVDEGLIKTRRGSIFVPRWGKLREEVMRWCHDFMICGRPSVRKMMAMLGREFYWHHMVTDVKWFVRTCVGNHRVDGDSPREVNSEGRSQSAPQERRPWTSKVRLRGDATRASRE
ncbi:uncharacterized protein LOC122722623 [Manihot esculenta]|uniref:uncharacterized protein LOC122722623 n=1 Tax=Manihot esculenta TaxID=3983 RepID=UPI001CC73CDA|nr:uncharacterized protein LOC122722623 [Manihot esculenta]